MARAMAFRLRCRFRANPTGYLHTSSKIAIFRPTSSNDVARAQEFALGLEPGARPTRLRS
jgi:hypothetical protein